MRLPRFLREIVATITRHAYDTAKTELQADLTGLPAAVRTVAASVAGKMVETAREDLRPDFDRIALFTILFRSQADQSRRMDSVDATLGVVLTGLLVLAPIAFEKAPTGTDKWIALIGFALLVLVIGHGLFFIGAPEPNATILAGKLLGDLKDPNNGSLEEVRAAITGQPQIQRTAQLATSSSAAVPPATSPKPSLRTGNGSGRNAFT